MNREEHERQILAIKEKNILLQLPTGFGKSKMAIDLLKHWDNNEMLKQNVLIVIPKLVLIQNWKDELAKWGYGGIVTFTTYISLHKYADRDWDAVIYDECQHFTERVAEVHICLKAIHTLCLSATVTPTIRQRLSECIPFLAEYKVSARKAIDDEILPDPKVILVKMHLSTSQDSTILVNTKNANKTIEVDWWHRNKYLYKKKKDYNLLIRCSEFQHYKYLTEQAEFWKKKFQETGRLGAKNLWLHIAGDRLKWLSSIKEKAVKYILQLHKNDRVLTFCADIGQTERLGKYCINSKNKESQTYYNMFNEGRIDHITACGILNEGVNITNCQYGVFAYLSNSDIVIKQRLGRLLRHKEPVIIIPYYVGTREEEIVAKMLKDYNPELVTVQQYS